LSFHLNECKLSASRTAAGRLFLTTGPATEKAPLLDFVLVRESTKVTISHDWQFISIHSFIHSYSFIISCQNATKHELGDAINSRMFKDSTIL